MCANSKLSQRRGSPHLTVPKLCQILLLNRDCARIPRHLIGLAVLFLQSLAFHLQFYLRILLEDLCVARIGGVSVFANEAFGIRVVHRFHESAFCFRGHDRFTDAKGGTLFGKQIKISRTDLYERDWTTPFRTLAKEFGLSDVGLAKLCRRHDIPLPGRGYWVRMHFGKKQERTALSDAKDATAETIVITAPASRSYEEDLPPRPSSILTVQIPEGDRREHPIASKVAKNFAKARPDDKGMLVPQSGQISAVGLTSDSLSRGLRLLDALLQFRCVDYRITVNPEVISSPVGLVPTNARAVTIALLARSRLGTDPQVTIGIPLQMADQPLTIPCRPDRGTGTERAW